MRKFLFILIAVMLPVVAFGGMQLRKTEPVTDDAIARLGERLDRGDVKLEFDSTWGYLPSLLKNLNVPVSSQTWVFSKTSLQVDHIAPWSPRAIYFNDDIYIGAVQNGPLIEISAVDPHTGGVFYTLSQREDAHPVFERQGTTCLLCHNSSSTRGVHGFLVRSVYPDRHGSAIASVGADISTDHTPMNERWGGWYVTGSHSEPESLGNWVSPLDVTEMGNTRMYLSRIRPGTETKKPLTEHFDTTTYLSPHSDIVALMVLTHQTNLHNLLTVTNQQSRKIRPDSSNALDPGDAMQRVVDPLVRAMLFVRQAPLSGPMRGSSKFATEFTALGPRDRKGRSLRDFDLEHRLFKHPLSYLVYSAAFDALPDAARRAIYRRFMDILTGQEDGDEYSHLSPADRAAILEILADTKAEFSAFIATAK